MICFRHILIIFFFSLIWEVDFSQDKQPSYVSYHTQVRNAEQLILDSNYLASAQLFDEIFSTYDFVFMQHTYTATQVAIVSDRFDLASSFFERGVKQGMKLEMAYEDSILFELTESAYWPSICNDFDSLRTIYLSKIDTVLRNKVNALYALDRKYREKHESNPWNFLWRPLIWMKWKKVTRDIVEGELTEIIETHGYPGEKLIGIDEKNMYYKKTDDSFGSFFATTILMHYYSVPRKASLNPALLREIEQGNILPEHYATLIDYQAEFGKSKYFKGTYYNQWHSTKDSTLFDAIDKSRLEIGLESLENLDRKTTRGLNHCRERKKGIIKLWHFCG